MERKDNWDHRRELEEALESANKHSEELEGLVRELYDQGDPNEDVTDKISEKSHAWSKEMRRYLGAVKKLYDRKSGDER